MTKILELSALTASAFASSWSLAGLLERLTYTVAPVEAR